MERVVVVGGGLAGHRALQALRGFGGLLTLISDEPHKPYDRPPLSKQVLLGEKQPDEMHFKCDGLDVEWMLGSAAEHLDTRRQVVELSGGEEIAYDGLVIASGRRARRWPDLPDLDGFFTLRSLDDAVRLKRAAAGKRRVAIVGAGFIGCEVAATLRSNGVEEVTLIDVADHPMPPIGAAAGAFAERIHTEHGVRFKLNAKVAGFTGENGRVSGVELSDDEPVDADVVLLALGSMPNSEWLEGSGVELWRGNVSCDGQLFVSGADNVVAAGDIAAWSHAQADGLVCIEHWATAREMAKVAAQNLVADPADRTAFSTVPSFWSDQYAVKIKAAGLLQLADQFEVVEEDTPTNRLLVEATRGGELVGAVAFNMSKTLIEYQRRLKQALQPDAGQTLCAGRDWAASHNTGGSGCAA